MRSRSKCRFHEKSKPCIEKVVLFTKNPVWGYIIFISTNRKVHFSYRSPCYFAIFRGFFVLHENFSFFSFLLKFYGVRGRCVYFTTHGGSVFATPIFRAFALLWFPLELLRFFVFRGFFVELRSCGFLFRHSDFSFFFVPLTPCLIKVVSSTDPGTKTRFRTKMT